MEVEEEFKGKKVNKQKRNDGGKSKNFRKKKTIRHQHKLILNEENAASEVPSSLYFLEKTEKAVSGSYAAMRR